ncbi:MAG: hypothetical protein QXO86_00075 [Nitrososphaerota archaeon]
MGAEELSKLEKKMAQAVALILASGHRLPGVRGWELRRRLGKNFPKIINSLDSRLKQIGLRVKLVPDPDAGPDDLDRARFYIVLSDPLTLSDIQTLGYSLDELAILSATLAYLLAKNGSASEKEVVEMLETKYPRWRVEAALERLARRGYLARTEEGVVSVGWRTLVEVDRQELLKAFASLSSNGELRQAQEKTGPEEGGEQAS